MAINTVEKFNKTSLKSLSNNLYSYLRDNNDKRIVINESFDFDDYKGIPCMEGLLQSLKFQDTAEQQRVLYMKAKEAKEYGSKRSWDRYLYWKGTKVDRFSKEYQSLLEKAYRSMLANPNFKQELVDSKRKILLL